MLFGKKKKTLLAATLLTINLLTIPSIAYAAPVFTGDIGMAWYPIYVKLEPWVDRFAVFLMVAGGIQLVTGYANDGAYSVMKGAAKFVGGASLLAIYKILV